LNDNNIEYAHENMNNEEEENSMNPDIENNFNVELFNFK